MAALSPGLPHPRSSGVLGWEEEREGQVSSSYQVFSGPLCGSSLHLWPALNACLRCLCGGLPGAGSLRDFRKTSPLEGSLMLGIRVSAPSVPPSSSTSCSLFPSEAHLPIQALLGGILARAQLSRPPHCPSSNRPCGDTSCFTVTSPFHSSCSGGHREMDASLS